MHIDRNRRINYIYKREFHSKIKKVDRKARGKTVKGMCTRNCICDKAHKRYSCSEIAFVLKSIKDTHAVSTEEDGNNYRNNNYNKSVKIIHLNQFIVIEALYQIYWGLQHELYFSVLIYSKPNPWIDCTFSNLSILLQIHILFDSPLLYKSIIINRFFERNSLIHSSSNPLISTKLDPCNPSSIS